MNDWDINPSKYLTDSEGNFKLKADGTPKKKGGRPKGSKSRGYNYHSQTKAKLAAKKQVRIKEKQIEQTRNKLNALRSSANTSKDVLAKLDDKESSTKGKIVEDIKSLPKKLKEEVEQNVVFKANEGPQTEFLAAGETDVLYGGAAGGGKSYAMLVDPLRYCDKAVHRT